MSLDKIVNSGALTNTNFDNKPAVTAKPRKAVKAETEDKETKQKVPDRRQIELALKNFKSTRFSYVLTDEVNRFIVKIIDRKTDKVIKQVPSEELQKLHDNLQEALGILFDQEI
ncbi:flagellar protein FlaG [Spirochaeta isovalerica]|uniref:Flagellar protein FlaG n=1 Tax=Spirochaeta isovalerica TaxID=150 RepID=A0A841R6A8_9SPIO|nr:flagellar protein FlaG [Spirochaeta isovalerica]MBB6478697.1 flagellar protein FlaG [Spirochaeta isovalerica]